jgi:hypothetical protein
MLNLAEPVPAALLMQLADAKELDVLAEQRPPPAELRIPPCSLVDERPQ